MFRPNFIEPENMIILGFELVKDKDNYMTYHNNATVHYNKIYCAKFWKDYNSIVRAKNPNLEVQSISRDKWINLIQENVGSVDPWYIKNLKILSP